MTRIIHRNKAENYFSVLELGEDGLYYTVSTTGDLSTAKRSASPTHPVNLSEPAPKRKPGRPRKVQP